MKNKRILFAGLGIAAFLFFASITASAQTSTTGQIEGTVVDTTGAAVPDATITLTGNRIRRPSTAASDASGAFRFSELPVGTYTVKVEATGFKSTSKTVRVRLTPGVRLTIRLTR